MANHDITTRTRTCTMCSLQKSLDSYYIIKSGRREGKHYSICKSCWTQKGKKWQENNREKSLAYTKKWRSANIEQARENSRRHSQENRATYSERHKAWRLENPERHRELFTQWVAANPERYKAALKARGQRYRARKLAAAGEFTSQQIKDLHALQRGKCPVCKGDLGKFHIDHVIALSRGGSNDIGNIQLLCKPCNLKKHAKDPIQFMQEQGFLL
jgi:5-methylcytosine-specific restriction endonuclease McrA